MLLLIPVTCLGLIVGLLIGAVGIGGVVLVPALVYLGGMEVQVAIASCMLSFLFSGSVGAVEFARQGSVRWSSAIWLCAGAAPGAFLGAWTIPHVSSLLLEAVIAALLTFSGLHALRAPPQRSAPTPRLAPAVLATLGLLVGYGSALSGTGGPLMLVPVLLWLQMPVLAAVGLSQVIQIPIAALATVGNVGFGSIDLQVAIALAVSLMIGVGFGARLAHRIPTILLKRTIAVVLVVTGGALCVRLASSVGFQF